MNDFFQNTYLQSALDWIKINYIKIILVVLILSIVFGWIYYKNLIQEENSKRASILFDEFNFLLNKDDIDLEALTLLREKTKDKYPDQIYSILMDFEISQLNYNLNNFQESLNNLRAINLELENNDNEVSFLKDLSRLRLSLLLISENEIDEAREILNKNFIFFEELKYEFLGDAELKSSNLEAARKNYETALELTSSEIHKELIRIKLSSIIN
jgi:predicted negative regulator of RcsB-dependent stress response